MNTQTLVHTLQSAKTLPPSFPEPPPPSPTVKASLFIVLLTARLAIKVIFTTLRYYSKIVILLCRLPPVIGVSRTERPQMRVSESMTGTADSSALL